MKYAFIQDQLTAADQARPFSVNTWCRVLEVSRSGFYEWQSRGTTPDPDTTALEVAARAAHARGRECYGPKRLRAELAEMGFVRSLATVKRLRSRLGLRCRHKRRFVRTTDGNHTLPIAPNLLEQQFNKTDAPNQVWVTDITYVPTDEGWLYVAAIKDLFNKKIVGWAMCDHMRTSLVSQALWMAFKQERPKSGLIHHSDRGSQGVFNRSSQQLKIKELEWQKQSMDDVSEMFACRWDRWVDPVWDLETSERVSGRHFGAG